MPPLTVKTMSRDDGGWSGCHRGSSSLTEATLLSVIVPLFNQRGFVAEALDSILRQAHRSIEVLVVDDASTDGSEEVVAGFGDRTRCIVQQRRKGPAAARNAGLRLARGNLIAFLDADDVWPDDKLRAQLPPLADNPEVDVVLGRIQLLEEARPGEGFQLGVHSWYGVQLGSAVFSRSVFNKVGHFNEDLLFSEDHDWFFRAREQEIALQRIDAVTLYHRKHPASLTGQRESGSYDLARVIKASLDRRRRQGAGRARSLGKLSESPKCGPSRGGM